MRKILSFLLWMLSCRGKKCYMVLPLLVSCKSIPIVSSKTEAPIISSIPTVTDIGTGCDPTLSLIGAACCVAGIALLVITKGMMGWRPVFGGVAFVVINYAMCKYAAYFFIPAAIVTGAISLAWGWKVVSRIINDDSIKLGEMKL